MSLKKIEQVKADKGFKIWDLIVYGCIIAMVIVVFVVVYAARDTSPLTGVRFKYVNEIIYEYDFKNGEIARNEDYVEITEENDEKLILRVSFNDGGFNVVEINKSGFVRVISANCSKQDCVYGNTFFNSEIKDNSGFIYCQPHAFKIQPYNFDIDDGNLIV